MKQIHEAVQTLESDIGFWRPSWILIKEVKKRKKKLRANSLGPICILQILENIGAVVYSYTCIIKY